MRAYPEYKDSGVEWLGEIPVHWKVYPIKKSVYVAGGFAFSSDSFSNSGIPIIRIGDISKDGSISLNRCKRISSLLGDKFNKYEVVNGDLLMAMTGATIGKAGLYSFDEKALLNQRVGVFKLKHQEFSYRFLWYLIGSKGYQEYIKLVAFGGAQPNISDAAMVDYLSGIPPFDEQIFIANHLDRETARIDKLISEKQNFIKLLKEKRQALISHVVTKGLDPHVKMKESGIEWIGEVPEHWEVGALGYYSTLSTGATPDRKNEDYWGGDIPWIKTGEVKYSIIFDSEETITLAGLKNSSVKISPPGTVLMAMYGQGVTRGRVAILGIHATYNQACVAIQPRQNLINIFLQYVLIAAYRYIRNVGNETSQMNLNADLVSKIKVTIPSAIEQYEICDYLDEKLSKLDDLEAETSISVSLLKEHRTALISAAITGKIDVRDQT